ncbi:sensor domain-containing diguanylate cyclase [Marinobacterium jannaschii]|uniref:sensor domain-containing diguanylate cyclase n=1 Tax=Marinobacterium jannaschii TaxID=64970 RepID=UPI000A015487|nr:sensor domain-containing diguanylate cyclase [Marinobacterium jannaschii]
MSQKPLERENRELKRTIRLMASKAERNDAIIKSFFDMELKLLSCTRLSDLLDLLLIEFKEYFRLNAVSLILFDPEQAARLLLDDYVPPPPANSLRFVKDQRLLSFFHPNKRLSVGELPGGMRPELFNNNQQIQSCALLPLIRDNCLIGSLHLGSHDPNRYSKQFHYDYIQHLASVISICIENSIIQENLRRLSTIDMLTRVRNRRAFDNEILQELSRAVRGNQPLGCVFIDLDYFKLVNDNYGHQTGDRVLRATGTFLKNQLRKTDVIARYGGEEFALLLPDCDQTQSMQVADTLRERFSQLVFKADDGTAFRMSASIGVTTYQPDGSITEDFTPLSYRLIQLADQAVYDAKSRGRNRVIYIPYSEKGVASTPVTAATPLIDGKIA